MDLKWEVRERRRAQREARKSDQGIALVRQKDGTFRQYSKELVSEAREGEEGEDEMHAPDPDIHFIQEEGRTYRLCPIDRFENEVRAPEPEVLLIPMEDFASLPGLAKEYSWGQTPCREVFSLDWPHELVRHSQADGDDNDSLIMIQWFRPYSSGHLRMGSVSGTPRPSWLFLGAQSLLKDMNFHSELNTLLHERGVYATHFRI